MCSPWQQQCCAAPGHLTDLASLCHYSGQPVIAWAEITVTAASPLLAHTHFLLFTFVKCCTGTWQLSMAFKSHDRCLLKINGDISK